MVSGMRWAVSVFTITRQGESYLTASSTEPGGMGSGALLPGFKS